MWSHIQCFFDISLNSWRANNLIHQFIIVVNPCWPPKEPNQDEDHICITLPYKDIAIWRLALLAWIAMRRLAASWWHWRELWRYSSGWLSPLCSHLIPRFPSLGLQMLLIKNQPVSSLGGHLCPRHRYISFDCWPCGFSLFKITLDGTWPIYFWWSVPVIFQLHTSYIMVIHTFFISRPLVKTLASLAWKALRVSATSWRH